METQQQFFETSGYRVLNAIRRIIRAVDIHSRKLNSEFNITAPQMICLYALDREDGITLSQLSKAVSLGSSTLTGILDRLELKGLAVRRRSSFDRRKILLHITEEGRQMVQKAPSPLQARLSSTLSTLSEMEQHTIARSLEHVVALMEADTIDALPTYLSSADI